MTSKPSFSSPLAPLRAAFDGVDRPHQGHAAAGHVALGRGGLGGVQRVVDAVLGLLHRRLGRAADVEDRHAAGQLREPLLELLAVVVAGGGLDLLLDLLHAAVDVGLLAAALDDRRVVLADGDLAGGAQLVELEAVELHAEVLGDEGRAGERGDVAEHRLAAVTEAGGLDGRDLQHAAEAVDDQRREGLVLHVLGDDEQRLLRHRHLVEQRAGGPAGC